MVKSLPALVFVHQGKGRKDRKPTPNGHFGQTEERERFAVSPRLLRAIHGLPRNLPVQSLKTLQEGLQGSVSSLSGD